LFVASWSFCPAPARAALACAAALAFGADFGAADAGAATGEGFGAGAPAVDDIFTSCPALSFFRRLQKRRAQAWRRRLPGPISAQQMLQRRAARPLQCDLCGRRRRSSSGRVGLIFALAYVRLDVGDMDSSLVVAHCGVSCSVVDRYAFDAWTSPIRFSTPCPLNTDRMSRTSTMLVFIAPP